MEKLPPKANVWELLPGIDVFPVRHGSAAFGQALRKHLWSKSYSQFLFAFPAGLEETALEGVSYLPEIQGAMITWQGKPRCYLPFDPCDAYVEGWRFALHERIPIHFLEDETRLQKPIETDLPDPYLAVAMGPEAYHSWVRSSGMRPSHGPELTALTNQVAQRLRQLSAERPEGSRLLFLCDYPILLALENQLHQESVETLLWNAHPLEGTSPARFLNNRDWGCTLFPIKPTQLYFALGEPPAYAARLERERLDPLSPTVEYLDLVKGLFVQTRNHFLGNDAEKQGVSVKKIQTALVYARNLAAVDRRLTPGLLDIITAAKGVLGPTFAIKVLEAARDYPYFSPEKSDQWMEVGIGKICAPDGLPQEAFNLLQDTPKAWRSLHLKRNPDRKQQLNYRYQWDTRGMCSHLPEDVRIERFNQAVRSRAHEQELLAQARVERLTVSLKDGVDLRETLRQWHSGAIHVREIPPQARRVDTVVILFDTAHDERYPTRMAWAFEHFDESMLTFYGTAPMDNMIGPGIAESEYGGLSLLFPPRLVPDIFKIPQAELNCRNLAEQLLFGALLNSREKAIAIVSAQKPGARLRLMAARFRKRLIHIPMQSFSSETLRRLRRFHILNGKHVRSWATRFISE